jgi:long-chain fatty acid transport protein
MRRLSHVVVALAVALGAGPALATNGMRMIGFGASQVGMGGASVALPIDAASVITNPAGMNELGRRLDFGASWFNPTVSYQATEIAQVPAPGFAVRRADRLDSSRGASPVPAFGLVLPVNDQLWFGLGAYGVAGMGVDFAQNLYGGTTYTSYSQMRFAPGLSYKVNDQISVGLTANVMYADMGFQAAGGVGQVAHQAASAFGVGGTLGAHYSPVPWFTLGAAYETKSWFGDFSFNVPEHDAIDFSTGQPVHVAAGKDVLHFDQPSSATVGFAMNPYAPVTLAFDAQLIRWSETNGQNLPAYHVSNAAQAFDMSWNDQWVFKVGAEWRAVPSLALRAGYNYGKNPLDASRAFENIAFPAVAEHHVTAGLGYDVTPRFTVNVAGMYAPETKLSGSNPRQMIASYQASMSQLALDMGIAYRF